MVENTIRVVVSTDLDVPTDIDQLRVVGKRGGATKFSKDFEQDVLSQLPDSMLLHNGQPVDDRGNYIYDPIEIDVQGRLADAIVLQRRAKLVFVTDRPVVLYMPLCRECVGKCPTQNCVAGTCSDDIDVSIDTLPEDNGSQPAESPECPSSST